MFSLLVSFTLVGILFMVSGGKLCLGSVPCLKASTFRANGNDRKHTGCGHSQLRCAEHLTGCCSCLQLHSSAAVVLDLPCYCGGILFCALAE